MSTHVAALTLMAQRLGPTHLFVEWSRPQLEPASSHTHALCLQQTPGSRVGRDDEEVVSKAKEHGHEVHGRDIPPDEEPVIRSLIKSV